MAKPIVSVIEQFKAHYSEAEAYSDAQTKELTTLYSWMRPKFAAALYNNVIRAHSTSFRIMPDVSAIEKAISGMNAPAVYDAPPALPPPEKDAEDRRKDVATVVAEALGKMDPVIITGGEDEPNHYMRNLARVRVMKGDATVHEKFWIRVIDEYGGNWKAAYAAEKEAYSKT